MKGNYKLILMIMFFLIFTGSASAQISSVYSNLTGSGCRTIKTDPETGGSETRCRGYGKWSLIVLDDDDRMSVNAVSPDGIRHELDFWTIVTTAFSSVGGKAEWRVQKNGKTVKPVALIIRVNATSEADGAPQRQSYLTVSKITDDGVCVVEKITSQRNANQLARAAADNAAAKPCLRPE